MSSGAIDIKQYTHLLKTSLNALRPMLVYLPANSLAETLKDFDRSGLEQLYIECLEKEEYEHCDVIQETLDLYKDIYLKAGIPIP